MANLQKIIKVTKAQYDTLASGGTVGDYTGLDANFLYLVQDDSATIIDITNGLTADIRAKVEANPACLLKNGYLIYTPFIQAQDETIPSAYCSIDSGSEHAYYMAIDWSTPAIDEVYDYVLATANDLTNYVTLDTAQTISSDKTIAYGNKTSYTLNNGNTFDLSGNQYNYLQIGYNNVGMYSFGTSQFFPNSNNSRDLGTSSLKWRNLYLSGSICLSNSTNTYNWTQENDGGDGINISRNGTVMYSYGASNFRPGSSNTKDLGNTNQKWKDLYMSGNISNGTYTWSFPTNTGTFLTNNSSIEVSKLTDTLSYNTRGNINSYDTLFVPDYSVDRLYLYGTYYSNSASSLIDIEYTQDGGTTWTDSGYPISTKQLVFTHNLSGHIKVGDASTTTSPTMTESTYQNYMTRVTIKRDTSDTKYYCNINKFFCISYGGNMGKVKIQYSTNADPTTFVDWNDWAEVSGWPGPNVMRLSSLKSFDGNGTTQLYAIRLIFGYSSFNASYASSMNTVGDFRFFGPGAFGDLVKNNDPYEVAYTGAVNPKLGDAKQDLGSTALRWRNAYLSGALYLTGNLHDGTNAVTVANIVTRNTAQTISATKTFTASPVIDNGQSTYNRRYTTISPLEWKMSSPSKTSMVTLTPNGLKMEKEDTPHYIELALNTSYVATIKHGASGAYTATFPAKTGTVAMTDDLPVVPEVPKLYKHIITHSQLGTNEKLIIFSFYATLDENTYLGLQKIVDRAIFVGLIPNSTSDANYYQIIVNRSSGGVNCTGHYFASTTPTNVTVYNPAINGSIVDTIEEVSI